jgi:general secretion pathway protein K
MILLNVLLFVTLAAGIVAAMIVSQDIAIGRATQMREAAQAMAIAEGGVLSAITALRRDALDQPESDHVGEPWAAVREAGAKIEGGTFDLAVSDAQGRFNVNNLRGDDFASPRSCRGSRVR